MSIRLGRLCPLLLLALAAPAGAQVEDGPAPGIDPEAGLPFWAWDAPPVEIRLIQRLPDQTRGFFIARGFSSASADRMARSCVFQSIQRNRGSGVDAPVLDLDLTQWRILPLDGVGSSPRPLALKEEWDQQWEQAGESDAARIAFRWSLFPTQQTFRGGDYNWGMISFGVPLGTRFDLMLAWTLDGEPQQAMLYGLTCAAELVESDGASPDNP